MLCQTNLLNGDQVIDEFLPIVTSHGCQINSRCVGAGCLLEFIKAKDLKLSILDSDVVLIQLQPILKHAVFRQGFEAKLEQSLNHFDLWFLDYLR